MPARTANAVWEGTLREGNGTMKFGNFEGAYSFPSRFESGEGTNPEELLGAAHAGCFSMAFSGNLTRAGFTPTRISTTATVHIERGDSGFSITRIELDTEADVPGMDEATFQEQAEAAKKSCPVSQALASVPNITLNARLVS
jgi:lipoyl-dependent peroxiredoxin